MPARAWLCNLGCLAYPEALALQQRLGRLRFECRINDILLLLEHPPTVTLGRFGKMANLLVSEEELMRRGIALCASDRGGDITFHCPGQLIVYPIVDLRAREGRLRDFLTSLEEVAIRALKSYGIPAERWSEHPGIWVGGKQIAAVGLRVSRGITQHGLSLNVNPDLSRFGVINLCGLPGKEATSIAEFLGRPVRLQDVRKRLAKSYAGVFGVELEPISAAQVKEDSLTASAPL